MKNADRPINPIVQEEYIAGNRILQCTQAGLTKREYLAGLALQGLCANYLRDNVTGWEIKSYAVEAVELADELLKALEYESND